MTLLPEGWKENEEDFCI